jgi:hypothetical protein
MHLNESTFDAAIEALREGGAVQIYPEGRSHSEPSLSPLRTGAARIALMAEARSGWQLGLRIQPVGLTYLRKSAFRARAIAAFGEPIAVASFREAYEQDEREAGRVLTSVIQEGLEELTLNFEHPEDQELVDVAERVYAREKRLASARERESMAERLPRLLRFAEGLRWLRTTDPVRLEALSEEVRRYMRLLTLFGAREGDVPRRYRLGPVLWYSAAQLLMLILVLPVAVLGFALWLVPARVSQWAVPRFRPTLDQVATYKIGTALVGFPLWLALLVGAAWLTAGLRIALVVLVVVPLTGLAAIAWRDRQAAVREDVRIFRRARRLTRGRDRLAELRAHLVAEFDTIIEEWAHHVDRTLGGS